MSEVIMSLMDLAALDTSELTAQVGRLQREGIYFLTVQKAGIVERETEDPADPSNYDLNFESLIEEYVPLKEEDGVGLDKSKIIGNTFKERYFIYGKDIIQAIQLLMGQYKSVGLRCKGQMGGVEGQAPGWIDEIVGKRIIVRVQHRMDKGGVERANIYWMTPKQMKKANIPLAVLGRDLLDEQGNPMEEAA
ncbi:hypothetical protein Bpfe_031115 [Biomphalaria pfeifferi]|uniref:Uncharacterized protein n=1 Tax=Biomphalaria pfeifferi TaxID=112525 RepID=A0AAD8EU47_BIOPF|nr:hypothetical protein Bpfe_031115 [Biomphalaria pfeifferi]